jgi:uncharacterized cupin superfamily protein
MDGPPDYEINGVELRSLKGGELLGATEYTLPPGSRWADLHYHHGNEELLIVLDGTPTLHMLDGERTLRAGELVPFRRGRQGAHRISNDSAAVARVVIVSTKNVPEIVEYPETDRVFAMSEPPWSDAPYDAARGRVIRSFRKQDGHPVPPDSNDP